VSGRTFVIGDIHGELSALETLLDRLPVAPDDTMVFLGDYVDRGPDSRGVIERVRAVAAAGAARVVTLRGNHEDMWLESWDAPNLGFLLPRSNGTVNTYRSFTGRAPLPPDEDVALDELARVVAVRDWLPGAVRDWMATLDLWFEDDHAIYVHAGVGRAAPGDAGWRHPSASAAKHLMWTRNADFFKGYRGKRLVIGHTPTRDIETGTTEIWRRGDVIAVDTAAGKGGFLSAIELPSLTVYDSRTC
jgi:serine/threonine protein phosphatase 1